MLIKFIFLYCALMIVTTAILAVRFRNPVHSVLAVLVLFFHMAGLYLLLNAEFLAAVQIIVYAGAILVLYLFVLFLVNIREEITTKRFVENHNISKFISFLVFLM
jgi:NADH-quinone oxidoreductase subunit J